MLLVSDRLFCAGRRLPRLGCVRYDGLCDSLRPLPLLLRPFNPDLRRYARQQDRCLLQRCVTSPLDGLPRLGGHCVHQRLRRLVEDVVFGIISTFVPENREFLATPSLFMCLVTRAIGWITRVISKHSRVNSLSGCFIKSNML